MTSISMPAAKGQIQPGIAYFHLDDAAVFSEVYERTHLIIFRYIYGLNGGYQQDAEDITALTYEKAWKARYRFVGTEDAVLGWLMTIAKRLVIDSYRQSARRGTPHSLEDMEVASGEAGPETHTLHHEQANMLRIMLATLPDDQREMLVLRYLLGWQVKAIADHLDMRENTVSVTIRRALERLRGRWPEARVLLGVGQEETVQVS